MKIHILIFLILPFLFIQCGEDGIPPETRFVPPVEVRAETDSSFLFSWEEYENPLIETYNIIVATDLELIDRVEGYNSIERPRTTASITVKGLESNTIYYVALQGVTRLQNATGFSDPIIAFTLMNAPTLKLDTPSITENSFKTSWTSPNSSSVVSGVELELATDKEFKNQVASVIIPKNKTDYEFTNLTENQNYYLRVRDISTQQTSSYSPYVELRTPIRPPVMTRVGRRGFENLIDLEWTFSDKADSYIIEVSRDSQFKAGSEIAKYKFDDLKGSIQNLPINHTYFFRSRAVINSIESKASNILEFEYKNVVINTSPTISNVNILTNQTVEVNWVEMDDIAEYEIYLARDKNFKFLVNFSEFKIKATDRYLFNNVKTGSYFLRLRGINHHGDPTEFSVIQTFDIYNNLTILDHMLLTTTTSFDLEWDEAPGADRYIVNIYSDANFTTSVQPQTIYTNASRKLGLTGLSPNRTFYVVIKPENDYIKNEVPYTVIASSDKLPPLPAINTLIISDQTHHSLKVRWPSQIGATSYLVSISEESDQSSKLPQYASLNFVVKGTDTVFPKLLSDKDHYISVQVQATDHFDSSNSPISIGKTSKVPNPSTITASDITTTSFKINWNTIDEVDHYLVTVSTVSSFNTSLPSYTDVEVPSGTTELTVTGLSSSVDYFFRVRAVTSSGAESAWSGVTSARTN